jgi:ABC-type multidrug transport system fused ATPase/permease subunit
MIVMVLALIWLVALVPFLLRRVSEHQLAASVSKFRSATGNLKKTCSAVATIRGVGQRTSTAPVPPPRSEAERRKRELERAQWRIARRRQLLARLVIGTGTTLILGALPHLHVLWDLSIVGIVLTGCYVSALAYLAHQPKDLMEIRQPLERVHQKVTHPRERLVAVGGGIEPVIVPMLPRRPSFVIVKPNS